MLPFVGDLDVEKTHVQAPTNVVLLCGGPTSDISAPEPRSLRDAFLKIHDLTALKNPAFIQAEDISRFDLFSKHYSDLLAFETELAQITELVLLFCESEGSFAELGAFAMVQEIARHLMVIMRGKYWKENSFIKLGPLLALENDYGKEAVFVLSDEDIGMRGDDPKDINVDALKTQLVSSIANRLEKAREPTTFNASRAGHLIKLAVGLIQEYGALTIEEIGEAFATFGIAKAEREISGYLLCAQSADWIFDKRVGYTNYYLPKDGVPTAAPFAMKEGAVEKDRLRRRLKIRAHWKEVDLPRYKLITGTSQENAA